MNKRPQLKFSLQPWRRISRVASAAFLILLINTTVFAQKKDNIGDQPDQLVVQKDLDDDTERISTLDKRIQHERTLLRNPFAIIPHKQNYILPLSYNSTPNNEPFSVLEGNVDKVEMKFQLSLKFSLLRKLFRENGFLFFAYTQQSFWQSYNTLRSSPFRETNYEPELMLSFFTDYNVLGFRNRMMTLGLVHQSNGRGDTLSRSWNRVYANFVFEKGPFYLSIKPWYRIPEDDEDDDNPDIEEFMGYGEINALYVGEGNTFGILLRNNLRSHNRWGVQIDWSFRVTTQLKWYVQYYGGYGESLIDYNHSNSRIGIGIMITNWL